MRAPRPASPRDQERKKSLRVGPRTQVPLTAALACSTFFARFRASPTSVLAEEKVTPEKKPIDVIAEATGSLDKMSGWLEGGIASAGNIVDNMSGYVRARLKWCPRS